MTILCLVMLFLSLLFPVLVYSSYNFFDMTIEQLMDIDIITLSRQEQRQWDAPSAIFVISEEDIHRSGASTIPELLRMVPGIEVGRARPFSWAVTSRGFNGIYANKLLVLVDDREVYSQMFSGVYWDALLMPLDNIARIEVIRGTGASIWGVNALNGVINIITKHPKDTQGALLEGQWSTKSTGYGTARYGGRIGEDVYFRIYGELMDINDFVDTAYNKEPLMLNAGFRIDLKPSLEEQITLSGNLYRNSFVNDTGTSILLRENTPLIINVNNDTTFNRAFIDAKYKRKISTDSELEISFSHTNTKIKAFYNNPSYSYSDVSTYNWSVSDLQLKHSFKLNSINNITWGAMYRRVHSQVGYYFPYYSEPEAMDEHIINAFIQDDITLIKDKLNIVIGSKFEHNRYKNLTAQPTLRLSYRPDQFQTLWAAYSQALRMPSFLERYARANLSVIETPSIEQPVIVQVRGNSELETEDLTSWEIGYRNRISKDLLIDLTAFYNRYARLITFEPDLIVSSKYPILPINIKNKMRGKTYGIEASSTWQPLHWWRIMPTLSYLQMLLTPDSDSMDREASLAEGKSPRFQASLRSMMNLHKNVNLDAAFYYTGKLRNLNIPESKILNLRFAWRPHKGMEISLIGSNLLNKEHAEFTEEFFGIPTHKVARSLSLRMTCWF